jgi:hypothetical protein
VNARLPHAINIDKPQLTMDHFSTDIYTEPSNIDVDTLNNRGRLRALACAQSVGIVFISWEANRNLVVRPRDYIDP